MPAPIIRAAPRGSGARMPGSNSNTSPAMASSRPAHWRSGRDSPRSRGGASMLSWTAANSSRAPVHQGAAGQPQQGKQGRIHPLFEQGEAAEYRIGSERSERQQGQQQQAGQWHPFTLSSVGAAQHGISCK